VLRNERSELYLPVALGVKLGCATMPLESCDHARARDREPAVSLAEVAFIFLSIGQPLSDQVAGAATGQKPCYGLSLGV
jgi:hypothetical protein